MSDDNGGKDKDTGRQDPPKDDPGRDDDGDDEDEDDSGDGGKPWTPPTQEEYERLQRTAQRRKEERLQARRELAELKKARTAPKKKESEDDDSGRDDEAAKEAAKEADRWRAVAVKQAAAASLSAAGFTGTAKQAARLTKLMDLDDAEPGRDGSFDFEEEVEELKEEFPHLFEDPRTGRRTPKVRTASGRGDGSKPDPVKRTSDRLLKSAGYR
jgi:hypothetical protein